MKKGRVAAALLALVVVAGAAGALVAPGSKPPPPKVEHTTVVYAPTPFAFRAPPPGTEANGSPLPPDTTNDTDMNCGPDQTTALQKFFNRVPDNSTVVFSPDACYTVDSGLIWQGSTNVLLMGNEATFNQWPPAPTFNPPAHKDDQVPILFLALDHGVRISNLNIQGAWDGFPNAGTAKAAQSTNGTSTITFGSSTSAISVGETVTGTGITATTTVSAVNQGTNTVTITPSTTGLSAGTNCTPTTNAGCYSFASPCACGHGVDYEGKLGILMEGNTDTTITHSTIQGTQGDGIALQLPTGTGSGNFAGNPINQDIVISDTTLNNIGYTFSVEAVDGLTFTDSTINNYQQIDFEVDEASSGFPTATGPPNFAAQDDIQISNDTMSNFNEFWWTSLQGSQVANPGITHRATATNGSTTLTFLAGMPPPDLSSISNGMVVTGPGITTTVTVTHVNTTTNVVTVSGATPGTLVAGPGDVYTFALATCQAAGAPLCFPQGCLGTACTSYWAVQQYNVLFSGNTIICGHTINNGCEFIEVEGQQAGVGFDDRHLNTKLTVLRNTLRGVAVSTDGGTCGANYGSTMTIKNVADVVIKYNVVHGAIDSLCPAGAVAALAAIQANRVNGLDVENNDFTGDVDTLNSHLSANNANVVTCNNTIGTNGNSIDSTTC